MSATMKAQLGDRAAKNFCPMMLDNDAKIRKSYHSKTVPIDDPRMTRPSSRLRPFTFATVAVMISPLIALPSVGFCAGVWVRRLFAGGYRIRSDGLRGRP